MLLGEVPNKIMHRRGRGGIAPARKPSPKKEGRSPKEKKMPVQIHRYESKLLQGNPLGDSPIRQIPVYIPEEASAHPEQKYPVLYALASFTGTGLSFLNYDFYKQNLPAQLDMLIGLQKMPPVVVVMVDSMTALGGNQFVDSPAVGPWASHIVEELIPWAEDHFPIQKGREHRGVFGSSSGGFGALQMALNHSESFAAAASHAGDCAFEYCYLPDIAPAFGALQRKGGLKNWMKHWRDEPELPGFVFPLLSVIAESAFYSPNPKAPYGFDLPFDVDTGAFRPEVFERWSAFDPVKLVPKRVEALRSLRCLYLDAGEMDEYNLQHGARLLHLALESNEIPHHYETFMGGHRGISYRYSVSMPILAKALL